MKEKGMKTFRTLIAAALILLCAQTSLFAADEDIAPIAETGQADNQFRIVVRPPGTINLRFKPADPELEPDVADIKELKLRLSDTPEGLFGIFWVYREVSGFNKGYEVMLRSVTPFTRQTPEKAQADTMAYKIFIGKTPQAGDAGDIEFAAGDTRDWDAGWTLFSDSTPEWTKKITIAVPTRDFHFESNYRGTMTFQVTVQ